MEILVRNAEGNVSNHHREYAAKKLGRLDRYFNAAKKVELVHREEGNGSHRIEITIFADGHTIRGHEVDADLHVAIDKVHDKLETRLRKLKGRLISNHRRKGAVPPPGLDEIHHEDDDVPHITLKERKTFLVKPMSIDEAALELELMDHAFYVFRNETDGQFAVLYKKKNGQYGLIEPEL